MATHGGLSPSFVKKCSGAQADFQRCLSYNIGSGMASRHAVRMFHSSPYWSRRILLKKKLQSFHRVNLGLVRSTRRKRMATFPEGRGHQEARDGCH